ncbi:hypothetical protein K9U40_14685 [Xanthobacter autotrophicus]|uniref:hypothetical protein n=1 Tax=Xanthobacter TaxID=279 RepID=UPI0024ABD9C5|nr:hypothetical protein [Xanthobacter autotrophicus]MDI4665560.1 hypothetical protein [Xanthobacter autotrophicus]
MTSQEHWSRLPLRLPPDLKAWLAAEAARNGASQNSEIVRAIRERMERTTSAEAVRQMEDDGSAPEPRRVPTPPSPQARATMLRARDAIADELLKQHDAKAK